MGLLCKPVIDVVIQWFRGIVARAPPSSMKLGSVVRRWRPGDLLPPLLHVEAFERLLSSPRNTCSEHEAVSNHWKCRPECFPRAGVTLDNAFELFPLPPGCRQTADVPAEITEEHANVLELESFFESSAEKIVVHRIAEILVKPEVLLIHRLTSATTCSGSIRLCTAARYYSSEEDFEIHSQIPVCDVLQVELHILFERRVSPGSHLPQASQSWRHIERPQVLQVVSLIIVHRVWSWTYQAYVAFEYIPEWQLIQAVLFQEPPDSCNAWIIVDLEVSTLALIQAEQ
jgi:hypothetical protein